MKECLCVFIWDKGSDVFTRPTVVDAKTKELKFKGKKANKCVIPESCNDVKLLRKIKKMCSHNAVIVRAKGK